MFVSAARSDLHRSGCPFGTKFWTLLKLLEILRSACIEGLSSLVRTMDRALRFDCGTWRLVRESSKLIEGARAAVESMYGVPSNEALGTLWLSWF